MKVVAIGIGSVIFGVNLLRDLFRTPEFRGCELWLVDVDADALGRMTRLALRLNAAAGWEARVESTTDRSDALPNADFVITAAAIDRIPTWRIDHELCLRHGFPSVLSENGGPGGLSHTLRSVPLMLDIATDIERLAPAALLFNYTNPENRVCLAISRHTMVRAIGLCHSVAEAIDRAARILERELAAVDVHAAGVNHFTWFVSIRDARDGSDLMPEFLERWQRVSDTDSRLGRLLFKTFGLAPAIDDDHVGEYLSWGADVVGTAGYDFDAHDKEAVAATERLQAWGAGTLPVESLLAEPSHEALVDHSPADIIADLVTRKTRRRPSFIVPNSKLIDGIPGGAAVEVPGLVEEGVPRGVPVGALPDPIATLVRHELTIQDLAVAAAVEGSRELALQALLIDPIVNSAREAGAFLDEILQTHRRHLPRFWS